MSSDCFHCGLPVPKGASYSVIINSNEQPMCCTGCQAVAQTIVDNNLTDFYNHRTEKSQKPSDLIPAELQVYDSDALQKSFVTFSHDDKQDGAIRDASLILEGIVCAACVWLNERNVKSLEGVIDFRVNYSTHRASLTWNNDKIKLSDVLKAIADTGYNAHPFDPSRLETLHKQEKSAALRRIALAGIGMMQVMMPAIAIYIGESSDMSESMRNFLRWISLIVTTPVVFYSSRIFFSAAWRDLKQGTFGMDMPVSIAIGSAYLASVWATLTNTGEVYFDSVVMFTFFLLLGRFLEMGARHKAGQVADALVRLLPDSAIRLDRYSKGSKDEKSEEFQTVIAASELALGNKILIKPGGVIPADGTLLEGVSSVNESLLTGESLPCHKQVGDNLIGGTVNIESPLVMMVTKLGDKTMLSSIIRLLDRAQSEKPNLAKFADKSAGWFVLLLLGIALAVFIYWWFTEPAQAFWVALSVLVITCPCALSLATPAALTAATGNLTEKGVLTTRGHALETLAKITHVIFDKTGTLTHGHLKVTQTKLLGSLNQEECQALAVGLEMSSEHPLAQAILQLSIKPVSTNSSVVISELKAESGRGVQGLYKERKVRLGTVSFVSEIISAKAPKHSASQALTTSVFLGVEGEWLAEFILQDELRSEAKETIKQLHQQGITVSLLSGDNQQAVESVANALGIKQAHSKLMPEDKLAHVQMLQATGEVVAMIGDGVNDAPVLAGADVSIAMGSGSQLAQASADMVLLSENLTLLPSSITISKRMQGVVRQNFAWAIVYNIVAIPIAAMGWVAPWMAVIGMSMSSLVVVMNALRLKK